jgi:tetratricopeptide (TPR) repeat protein
MSARNTQLVLLGSALVLFVLLFIAPRTTASEEEKGFAAGRPSADPAPTANVEVYLNTAVKNLDETQGKKYASLKDSQSHDSLAAFWNSQKRPDLAAWFFETSAKKENTVEAWKKAGNRYYYSVQFTEDKSEIPVLYQSAIRCFEKAIQIDPHDTDARIMMASCFVDGSSDPMKGITMLREIEKTDSNNVKLNMSLAFFSVKSGQLDRAITRFNKVLKADSTYIEAYLHLADVYEQKQDTENTILMLQKYAAKTPEATAKAEINRYIEQLKGNNKQIN